MMFNQVLPLPFKEENGKVVLTGPVVLHCGCGGVLARWATLQQQLPRLPQGKPKSSKIIWQWVQQEMPKEPLLKGHQYGVVVAETEKGFELVDIMAGATPHVVEKITNLLKRNKEWTSKQSLSN